MNENNVIDFKGIKLAIVPRLKNCKGCYGDSALGNDDMSLCDIVCPDDGSPLFESENYNRAITEDQYNKEQGWLQMDAAPKDGSKIIAWCKHDKDEYHLPNGRLTIYGAHCDVFGCHAEDGLNVVSFGGGTGECPNEGGYIPDWWFVDDGNFKTVANPVLWMKYKEPKFFD